MNADLRGLVAQLESNKANQRHATHAELAYWHDQWRLLAEQAIAALSVAQGQGSILPDAYMTEDGRYVDPTIADQFPGAVPLYSYPPRYAAPAQPDGVSTYQSATNSAGIGSCAEKGGLTEAQKVERDAYLYGTGFMRDGKHIPAQEVMVSFRHDWATDGMGDYCRYCKKREDSYTPPAQAAESVQVAYNPGAVLSKQAAEAVERAMDVADTIMNRLEGWDRAYPIDIFREVTDAEMKWLHETRPGLIDRISAGMGRHMAGCIREDLTTLRAAIAAMQAGEESK